MATLSETPYGAFNYLVLFDGEPEGIRAGFSEVSGLNMEVQVVEYRAGNYRNTSPVKIPGLTKYTPVTLKRGLIGSLDLYEWFIESARSGGNHRRDVVIHLLNGEHETVFTWKLRNAWVSKYSGSDLKADSSEVAMETIELVHDGLTIE